MLLLLVVFSCRTVPSALELPQIMSHCDVRAFTADRELGNMFPHPAPKTFFSLYYRGRMAYSSCDNIVMIISRYFNLSNIASSKSLPPHKFRQFIKRAN